MSKNNNTTNSTDMANVLYSLPVTKQTINRAIVALTLHCHGSYRGIQSFLEDIFDYKISIGSIHNIQQDVCAKADRINKSADLSPVEIGAHDEIFQGREPVLIGGCTQSTYCYLLKKEDSRDGTTWGMNLLDLKEQGFDPETVIGDGGQGLRAGLMAADFKAEFRSDIFHAVQDFTKVLFYCTNRAYGAMTKRFVLERKMIKAKKKNRGHQYSKNLVRARANETRAVKVAETLETLLEWLRNDVLAIVGPDHAIRSKLFDFIVEELRNIQKLASHHVEKLIAKMANRKDTLIKFALEVAQRLAAVAMQYNVEKELVTAVYSLQNIPLESTFLWCRLDQLKNKLGNLYYPIEIATQEIIETTVRASSIAENINSRLRPYFFLMKQFGQKALNLVRFYLNHKPFLRSARDERVGKSPAEILSGKPHSHWLAMLGFTLFKRTA